MRRLAALVLLTACAHASRSKDPQAWTELESEHFVLRTDLPPVDAREAIADLEVLRAALIAAGWHGTKLAQRPTLVVELASEKELQEFAIKRLDGFVAADAFGEPIMVVSAGGSEQTVFKHELAHLITNEFLVSKPRWVQEGIACYLETLRFEDGRRKMVMGDASPLRRAYLKQYPVLDYTWVMQTGVEAERMDAAAQYAFETGAWLLVHWLVDTRAASFDAFLTRLARGDEWQQAFHAEFPDLPNETAIRGGMATYLKNASVRRDEGPAPRWEGAIAARRIDPGEVYALRADLLRLSPGYGKSPEREALLKAELALALAADPGNPLALQLTPGADPQPAVAAHPDDWRTWVLVADRRKDDPSAIEKAARLAPRNPGVLERLALVELGRGDRDRALEHAVQAAEIAPARADVLDTLAQIYAAVNRCADAHAVEQRAIDSLPDAAFASAPTLRKRLDFIDRHCGEEGLQHAILVQPVQKGCARKLPPASAKEHIKGAITGEFTIHEDGSVADVTVTGDASRPFMDAMKKYFESCSYQPVVYEGKPLTVKSTVLIKFGERK